MKEVYEFLDSLSIKHDETLIVAVSYGPDSMFLLDLIKNKFKSNKIVCAHVHHNHRKESDYEAEKLEEYCNNNNIIFEMMKIDKYKNNKFTEEEARNKRYTFFNKIIQKYNSKYLFTAHHGDDLVETILMKISRGSSIKGYSGISSISKRDNYKIIRPLLYLTKKEIEESCINNKIPFTQDKSNLDNLYTRNRFRNNILPTLKEENQDIHRKFMDFSNKLQKYEEYISNTVDKYYEEVISNNVINIKKIKELDEFIQEKIIERYLLNIYGENIKLLTDIHSKNIINLVNNDKPNSILSFPQDKKCVKSYDKIYFDKESDYNTYCYMFDGYVDLPNGSYIKEVDSLDNTSNYMTAFSLSDITLPLYVRNKYDGDKIEILGLNGTKKVKDVFINEKLDKNKRINHPILVDSTGKILWIPGVKKSKYDKSKKGKYDIILKYNEEEYNAK